MHDLFPAVAVTHTCCISHTSELSVACSMFAVGTIDDVSTLRDKRVDWIVKSIRVFTAPCFSNGAVMPSLDVRLSVCLSVCDVGDS